MSDADEKGGWHTIATLRIANEVSDVIPDTFLYVGPIASLTCFLLLQYVDLATIATVAVPCNSKKG